ncbi:hypothetical protein EV356DRAFT_87796 [Viridothelium virens]|uniref:Uncharacterized protein n=1 Tax=Viridothelium virens TaxID=1048519 RepID=A0A6A6GSI2_VIRVR|nr:hypothetical protein EV356DRAFT_87796 [Viridothelium virens]
MDVQEKLLFLPKSGKETVSFSTGSCNFIVVVVSTFSVAIHVLLFLTAFLRSGKGCQGYQPMLYTPFQAPIRKTVQVWWPGDAWDSSDYIGPPTSSRDEAWDRLQQVQGIRLKPDEAAKLSLSKEMLLKNGDQGVFLGYQHNLHCIRYLYQSLHPEVYGRMSGHDHAALEHSYHCLEVLRRSTLCQPDLTLTEIFWKNDKNDSVTLKADSPRECLDIGAIMRVAEGRKYSRSEVTSVQA